MDVLRLSIQGLFELCRGTYLKPSGIRNEMTKPGSPLYGSPDPMKPIQAALATLEGEGFIEPTVLNGEHYFRLAGHSC